MRAAGTKAPSGAMMLLKALGVDPAMIGQVAHAVTAILETMQRIEEKQDRILALLEVRSNGNGDTSNSGSVGQ